MILLLGHCDDALIREVSLRLCGGGVPMVCLGEPQLFASTPFTFRQSRNGSTGTLRVGEITIRTKEISGVLMRLPRLWWPSEEFDLQDQMFVYHECSAAWFALLASLGCPMINRFDLAWWLNDATYPDALAHELGRQLAIPTHIDPPPEPLPARILPAPPPAGSSSVYVVGHALIPREPDDVPASSWIAQYSPGLAHWQRESGTELCRLDLGKQGDDFFLQHVELFPLFDQEPAAVVHRITNATVEMLA
jgi:hypothetical protein